MTRAFLVVCSTLAVLAVVGCGGEQSTAPTTRAKAPRSETRDLRSIDDLRSAFNAKSAEPRLILIISPT